MFIQSTYMEQMEQNILKIDTIKHNLAQNILQVQEEILKYNESDN